MEDFRNLFFEESKELISQLEDDLMKLEENPSDTELVNSIFRIMHSLKGSGAMFGYNNLSSFTHKLESLYDEIRSKKIELSPEIISFTIDITSHIKNLLADNDSEDLVNVSKDYIKFIETRFLETITEEEKISAATEEETAIEQAVLSKNKIYYIEFTPNENIFNDGTKPLYLLDELSDLGKCILSTNISKLPTLSEIDPNLCYLSWKIIISTSKTEEMLKDVFIFVYDDSKIVIELLSEIDIFEIKDVKPKLQKVLNEGLQDLKGLKRLVKIYTKGIAKAAEIAKPEIIPQQVPDLQAIINKESKIPHAENKEHKDISGIESIRISSRKLDDLINLVSEFVTNQARLFNIAQHVNSVAINELSEDFQSLSRQFRDIAFEMRLIPIQTLVVKFKRLVRDLSKQLNKKVNFITEGTQTELDKNIIATISDPIMHIIRNSIDHGIESPERRMELNKEGIGKLVFKAENSGAFVIISISDDGAGIDPEIIFKKAIEKNIIHESDQLDNNEIIQLVMHPGFTTNEEVTSISGRGVGMDVVKKNIESLRGEVEIKSEVDKGTSIIIKLPLTLSIIDGLLTIVNQNFYIFPLSSVIKIHHISKKELDASYKNLITLDEKQYYFVNLCNLFNQPTDDTVAFDLLLVSYKDAEVGLIVNEIVSEYQAVLKPLDNISSANDVFSGASILGDGKLAMVLDTSKLISRYSNNR